MVSLTIAGSDCSAGAGIQADLKTFSLLGIHGLTAISTVVAQTPMKVLGHQDLSLSLLKQQIDVVLSSYPVAAIKTGLLGSASQVSAVAAAIAGTDTPLIVDPVLAISSGTDFGSKDTIKAYIEDLLPMANLVTPNLPEALRLLGKRDPCASKGQHPADIARELSQLLNISVLLTGGHSMSKGTVTDILYAHGEIHEFSHSRIDLPNAHGTGCTYSAAITGFLALGDELTEAISKAQLLMKRVLTSSYHWTQKGDGHDLYALNQLPDEPPFKGRTS